MDLHLKGKVAIVTGASKGIGRSIAQELASEGMRVTVVARSRDELLSLAAPIGDNCLVHAADLTDPSVPAAVVAATLERVVGETDRPEVRERARQLLAVSRQKAQEAGGKAAKEPEADPYLLAVYQKNRGDFQAALDICRKEGRDSKDERFAYLVASIHAAEGRIEEAAQALSRAAELNPKNRIHAFHDPDFAELRKNRDYRPLFGLS